MTLIFIALYGQMVFSTSIEVDEITLNWLDIGCDTISQFLIKHIV